MGRAPCCEKVGLKRGRWTDEEDGKLRKYIEENGEGSWRSLPKNAGLLRCGKSCRLRWINYLRTDLKRGSISAQEEEIIINLHASMGNRWSLIAAHLPGRTDNEIKNYWNSHLSRKIDSYRRPNPNFIPPAAPSKAGGGRKKKMKNNNNKNKNKGEAAGMCNKEGACAAANGSVLMPATPTPERETITKSSSGNGNGNGNEERSREMVAEAEGGGWYDLDLQVQVVDGDGSGSGSGSGSTSAMEDLSGLWDPGMGLEINVSQDQLAPRSGNGETPAFEEEDTFSWFWDDDWNSDDRETNEIDDAILSWLLS